MTIDELIKSLQEAKQTYGNVNVRVCDTDDVALNITDISALDERQPKEEYKDTIHAVSVNFSVYQMTNPNIVEIVLNTISKYKIKPENIIMEITESIFIDDFDLIRQRMIELSNAGIVFYLDDFGTGFSNFANVITLPFSTIKIDRSFVQMMEQNAEMVSLIDNLIKTFKESGLKILVEGVENDIQDKLVKDAGTDYIQGFLYAKPISQTELLDFLK